MPGSAIGTSLNYGFAGTISHGQEPIIDSKTVKEGTDDIPFGSAVILNTDNTVELAGASATAAKFAGIAVAEVKQNNAYGPNMGTTAGAFAELQKASILKEGIICVKCSRGTPTAGGDVYLRTALSTGIPAAKIGDLEASSDGSNSVKLTNAAWYSGKKDANNIAELRLKYANN